MSFVLKIKKFFILLILIQTLWTCFAEANVRSIDILRNGTYGEYNTETPCQKKHKICPCPPKLKNSKTHNIPFAEENEKCDKREDCCGMLICVDGICRKPSPNIELVTLVKICLGIVVSVTVLGMIGALIKYLIKHVRLHAFRRNNDPWTLNSTLEQGLNAEHVYDIRKEKPPSYEECLVPGKRKQPEERQPPL